MKDLLKLLCLCLPVCLLNCATQTTHINTLYNSYGQPVFWETDELPITIVIHNSISPYYTNVIVEQISIWNAAAGGELFDYTFGSRQFAIDLPGSSCFLSTRHFESRNYQNEQILARVVRYFRMQNLDWSSVWFCEIEVWNQLEPEHWENVLRHELGHVIGLRHDPEPNSIMFRHALRTRSFIEEQDQVWAQYLMRRSRR